MTFQGGVGGSRGCQVWPSFMTQNPAWETPSRAQAPHLLCNHTFGSSSLGLDTGSTRHLHMPCLPRGHLCYTLRYQCRAFRNEQGTYFRSDKYCGEDCTEDLYRTETLCEGHTPSPQAPAFILDLTSANIFFCEEKLSHYVMQTLRGNREPLLYDLPHMRTWAQVLKQ